MYDWHTMYYQEEKLQLNPTLYDLSQAFVWGISRSVCFSAFSTGVARRHCAAHKLFMLNAKSATADVAVRNVFVVTIESTGLVVARGLG